MKREEKKKIADYSWGGGDYTGGGGEITQGGRTRKCLKE